VCEAAMAKAKTTNTVNLIFLICKKPNINSDP
jgi:hypothetical protein